MLLGSRTHTAGDTRRWRVNYARWLANTASIVSADVISSTPSCTIDDVVTLGKELQFLLIGGNVGETVTVTIQMTDSLDNIKTDHATFSVVAP